MRKKFIPWFVYVPWFVFSLSLVMYVWIAHPELMWRSHFDRYTLALVPWVLHSIAITWYIDVPLRRKVR